MILSGRVWKLADRGRAVDLLPARHDRAAMTARWEECADHVLEDVRPDAHGAIEPGDIVVGGRNLGGGHAHYHRGAVMACRHAGFGAILGEAVNAYFLRAAIDEGLFAWSYPGMTSLVDDGDRLRLDVAAGLAINETTGAATSFAAMPQVMLDLLEAGGSRNWALARVAGRLEPRA